jgi:hypothetical protein
MPETPNPQTPAVPDVQTRLQEVARILRQSGTVDAESRDALADLVDELSKNLQTASVPPAEVTHLALTTAHLAEALHRHQGEVPVSLRDRLARAAVNAEAHAPTAVGLTRRLLDALANIGI